MDRRWVAIGATLAALGVGLGAFGAHAIRDRVEPRLFENWQTGAHYHQLHAVALIVIGMLPAKQGRDLAATLICVGQIIFASTLYAMALGGPKFLGAITPLGGASLIAGWLILAVTYGRK